MGMEIEFEIDAPKMPVTPLLFAILKASIEAWNKNVIRRLVKEDAVIIKMGSCGELLLWADTLRPVKCFARNDPLCTYASKYKGEMITGSPCDFCPFFLFYGFTCSEFGWVSFYKEPNLTTAVKVLRALQRIERFAIVDSPAYYRLIQERIEAAKVEPQYLFREVIESDDLGNMA